MVAYSTMALNWLASISLLVATASGAALQIPLRVSGSDAAVTGAKAIEQLRTIFGENLINAYPVGKPCYSKPDPINATECSNVSKLKMVDTFISNHPGGYFYGNWASCQALKQDCALPLNNMSKPVDSTRTCYQGTVPDHMIAVERPEDVQAIFAKAQLSQTPPLIIKNTGHDWKGRSSAPGSLGIWTRHWPDQMKLEENFKPLNCNKQPSDTVISFGPGANWGDVYQFAHVSGRGFSVVGGTCKTVGVAGWLHGGGHSPLTPVYGMGVDNVRQIEIVTPDGKRQIANECINEDLFFAVRGGGGGTWGVVTRIWYKAWDKIKVVEFSASLGSRTTAEKDDFTKIITSNALNWSTQGWGGYLKPTIVNDSIELVNSYRGIGVDEAKAQMKPLLEFLERHKIQPKFKLWDSWYEYVLDHMAPTDHHPGSWSLVPAARLLPRELFNDPISLADNLSKVYKENITLLLMMVTPTIYNHTTTSALHPSWKTAIMSARANNRWDLYEDGDSYTQLKKLHRSFDTIRQLAPNTGVSMSETHIWEPGHELVFWGKENFERLSRIKKEIDPRNLLSVWHGVGFDRDDPRFRCYPSP